MKCLARSALLALAALGAALPLCATADLMPADVTTTGASVTTTVLSDQSTVVKFLADGTFTVPAGATARLLLVGGGGSGGHDCAAGGGAGGFVEASDVELSPGTYTVTVGAGGAQTTSGGKGNNGSPTILTFGGTDLYTALGGGGGGGWNSTSGASGASGGGACNNGTGGTGTEGQGFAGGNAGYRSRAGGGGAGGPGESNSGGDSVVGGAGGPGKASDITGEQVYYAGGGGGGGHNYSSGPLANGGLGGGGSGVRNVSVATRQANVLADGRTEYEAEAGVNGLGGGGGGGNNSTYEGRPGGSGVLIVRLDPVASGPDPVLLVTGTEDGVNSAVIRVCLASVGDNAATATVSYKFATSVANLETADPLVAAADVPAGTTIPISLTGLDGGTTVYVRVFAENDLLVAATPVDATVHSLVGFAPDSFDLSATFTITGYAGTDPLTNFPVLVRLSENSPAGFAYADCAADGSDLRFTDAAGNLIPHEIDTWNPAGESLLWVRVPVVTVGTTFKMYFSATVPGVPSSEDVWARYAAVIHGGSSIANAVAGGPAVSTPSGSDKVFASADAGTIGGGIRKNTANTIGVNVAMGTGSSLTSLADAGKFSVSGWFKFNSTGTQILGGSRPQWDSGEGYLWLQEGGKYISVAAFKSHQWSSGAYKFPQGEWAYGAFTYESGVSLKSYFNGAPDQTKASPGNLVSSDGIWTFGSYGNAGSDDSLVGDMDELRIFNGVASGDWIQAEHDTIASATFLSAAAVVPVGASAAPVVGLAASLVEYTNATFSATVGSLGMDAGKTTDATWADLLLVVGTEATLSSPAFAVPLSRATSAPMQVAASLAGLSADTVYYAQLRATNSLGVAGESRVAAFTTLPPGPAFTATIVSDHLVPEITLSFTRAGQAASVTRITVLVSGSGDLDHPDVTKTLEVNLAEMPVVMDGIDLVGLPASSTLSYRFIAENSGRFSTVVDAQAASTIGDGNNVWSGLSEDIDDSNAYVFAGGLPAPGKTLYFTKPAGLSPIVDQDVAMPSLRFTVNTASDPDYDSACREGFHSFGYDLSGAGTLSFTAERPIVHATKGTNVVRNPLLFNRTDGQTVYLIGRRGRLDLTGELMLPEGVSNTTMRVNGEGGEVHFGGPSPDFMGTLHLESSFTLSLDSSFALTNINRIFFGGGWESYTYLKNNTGAPMTFPRCTRIENQTGWSCADSCYAGAPFIFPVGTLVWNPRAYDHCTINADLVVQNIIVSKNDSNGSAVLDKAGTGTLAVTDTTEWSTHDCNHYIRLRNGCFWPQTAAGQSPSGEYYAPEGANNNMGTLGLSDDYNPMLDGSATPRVFQGGTQTRWGFTGFGGDRTVCWNGDSSLNLTNTTSDNVSIKLTDATTVNSVGKTYNNYYAYPARFMFGNRSEFADGTVIFRNPIRYEFGQNWDTSTYFESTNHVVAARMRGSLKLGNRDKTWNFSGRNFGGYLALEAENTDFTGKVNVCDKGNLLVNSNLVARSATVQSGAGLGGTGTLSTEDGTTVKSGGSLFGGEWNKGGVLTLGGKVTLEGGSALRAEVGASNDRIGMVKLAPGSTLKLTAPVYVDIATDPRVSPVRGASCKILDWSEASFDSGSAPKREDFVARPESNSDIRSIYVVVRDDGLYVNYISVRCPPSTIMILR